MKRTSAVITLTIAIIIIIFIIVLIYLQTNSKDGFVNTGKTLTYQEFKEYYDNDTPKNKTIPKIVFRTGPFKLEDAPDVVKQNLDDVILKNPDYIQVYFDDDDCRMFIQDYFKQYILEYDILIPTAFKADLWRLLVIYKYGGIYNDIGHKYMLQIRDIVSDEDETVFCVDDIHYHLTGIHNAFFASYPKSPIVKCIIDDITSNIRNRSYGINPLSITGPHAWAMSLNDYLRRNINSKFKRGVMHDEKGNKLTLVEIIVHRFKDPMNHIVNINGDMCILSKFPKYYEIMYDNRKVLHYGELWHNRQVYK